jgi:DNA-binding MarR family transcriptional regulator
MNDGRPVATPLIGTLLAVPHHELQQRVQAGLAAAGLPEIRPAHAAIFQWLPPEGGRATELAERIGTTKQAVGYLIEYLEEHGFIERVPDPGDGRALLVRRTAKGWLVNQTARRLVEEVQAEWAERLGAGKLDELRGLLTELVEVLGFEYSPQVGGSVESAGAPGGIGVPHGAGAPASPPGTSGSTDPVAAPSASSSSRRRRTSDPSSSG